jgi:hypothetical protein
MGPAVSQAKPPLQPMICHAPASTLTPDFCFDPVSADVVWIV